MATITQPRTSLFFVRPTVRSRTSARPASKFVTVLLRALSALSA
jgi:hypothetical protein